MTKQANININTCKDMRPKTLAASVIATATLIAMIGIVTSTSDYSINAQVMMEDRGGFENMTSGLQAHQQKMMLNGTIKLEQINLEQTILEAIGSKANTSLTQAMTTAEQSVGNNSFAFAAFSGDQGGYFVYTIILGTPGMELYYIIVDPGNGQVLTKEKISQEELENRHQIHMNASSVGGSPFLH